MYQTVKAHELRNGDLMRLGSSTNHVLISSATNDGGRIRYTTYTGDDPQLDGPTWTLDPDADVSLSGRNLGPTDTIGG